MEKAPHNETPEEKIARIKATLGQAQKKESKRLEKRKQILEKIERNIEELKKGGGKIPKRFRKSSGFMSKLKKGVAIATAGVGLLGVGNQTYKWWKGDTEIGERIERQKDAPTQKTRQEEKRQEPEVTQEPQLDPTRPSPIPQEERDAPPPKPTEPEPEKTKTEPTPTRAKQAPRVETKTESAPEKPKQTARAERKESEEFSSVATTPTIRPASRVESAPKPDVLSEQQAKELREKIEKQMREIEADRELQQKIKVVLDARREIPNLKTWDEMKNIPGVEFYLNPEKSRDDPLVNFLHWAEKVTKTRPLGGQYDTAEKLGDYLRRALEKAEKEGLLDQLDLK